MPEEPSFEISHEGEASETLVIGLSEVGMSGLTAADYLTENLELEECGHITTSDLPSLTPFENGIPRHHTRFFSREELDITVLTSELFIPVWSTQTFSESILEWARENDVNEIVFLSGAPIQHVPEDHRVFYVATKDYRETRLKETEIQPMVGGFLEGVSADIVKEGIDSPLSVGVLLTPVHPPAQDVEASLRLIEAFEKTYEIDVETGPLEDYADELQEYYDQLSQRLNSITERSNRKELPEDRAFM